jgi:hypothetical protein
MNLSFFKSATARMSVTDEQQRKADLDAKIKTLAKFIYQDANYEKLKAEHSGKEDGLNHGGHIDFDALAPQLGHFNATSEASIEVLQRSMDNYQLQLNRLKTVDFKLALSLFIGVTAIALSPLSLGLSLLASASAFTYFGYQLKAREDVREAYSDAQNDMVATYIWVMNDKKATITSKGQALPSFNPEEPNKYPKEVQDALHPTVKRMHEICNPMFTDQDIWDYTRNDLDKAITVDRKEQTDEAIANEATTKAQLTMDYLLYGFHQGSNAQLAMGILSYVKQGVMSLAKQVSQFFAKSAAEDAVEDFTATTPTATR